MGVKGEEVSSAQYVRLEIVDNTGSWVGSRPSFFKDKGPVWNEKLTGPIIVACHWNKLSPVGPAEQEEGGSRPRSRSSSKEGGRKGRVSELGREGGGRNSPSLSESV